MEAFASGNPVTHIDLHAAVERWPRFTPYAICAGYDSVYAIPLRLRGEIIGALNLFRSDSGALTDGDIALARALADLASITILQAQAAFTELATQIVDRRFDLETLVITAPSHNR